MVGNINLNYSAWTNRRAYNLAKKADTDENKGLQGSEVTDFVRSSIDNNIKKSEIYGLMGLTLSNARKTSTRAVADWSDADFKKAADFYNDNMTSYQRYSVSSKTYDILQDRLYKMEKGIDQALIDCDAYSDIMIVPRWHYRYYPRFEDRLINFDIADLRERTTKDMTSLQELKDKIEYIIEEANGETEHKSPTKTEYDVEAMAQKHLGMSYKEFAEKYKDELEFCKTVTYADFNHMDATQAEVYRKAKAYAKEMLTTTINEAHTVNWNIGERKLEETMKASGDMYTISEFEDDGITEQGLSEIKSGIMYQSFKEALIDKYNELKDSGEDNPETSVESAKSEEKPKKPVKCIINGALVVINPDGTIYNLNGQRIK